MSTNIPIGDAGMAASEFSDTFTSTELFNSAIPQAVTEDFEVPENSDFEQFAVVALTADDTLTMAVDGAAQAVGILLLSVQTGAGETKRVPIYRAGNFNVAALQFDASFDTDEKKLGAFRGAPAPTNIVVRSRL